jgi:hypothetical protein
MEHHHFYGTTHYKWQVSIAMLVYQRVSRIQDVPHLCRQGVALHRGCPREGLRRMTAMAPMGTDAMGRRCGFEMIFDNQCGDLS